MSKGSSSSDSGDAKKSSGMIFLFVALGLCGAFILAFIAFHKTNKTRGTAVQGGEVPVTSVRAASCVSGGGGDDDRDGDSVLQGWM